jgi:hypothetical protein
MLRRLLLVVGLSSVAFAQNPVGQLFSSDAKVKGSVELAASGARVLSGSFVTAADSTAVLKLDRGGEIRICARTSLSVATSQSGRDLMLGLSLGCIETHYTVSATADLVVTPDFRLLLAGPGRFDFAIEAAKSGDTCIRALPGNSSSLIVSELMGDATYQVKPAERLVFHHGRLQDPDHDNANCGCVSNAPVMRAESTPPVTNSEPATSSTAKPESREPKAETPEPKHEPPVHVEVDAPFVFHADDPGPSPLEQAVSLHLENRPLPLIVLPPVAADTVTRANVPQPAVDKPANKPKQGRFFGRIRSFFAAIFH